MLILLTHKLTQLVGFLEHPSNIYIVIQTNHFLRCAVPHLFRLNIKSLRFLWEWNAFLVSSTALYTCISRHHVTWRLQKGRVRTVGERLRAHLCGCTCRDNARATDNCFFKPLFLTSGHYICIHIAKQNTYCK